MPLSCHPAVRLSAEGRACERSRRPRIGVPSHAECTAREVVSVGVRTLYVRTLYARSTCDCRPCAHVTVRKLAAPFWRLAVCSRRARCSVTRRCAARFPTRSCERRRECAEQRGDANAQSKINYHPEGMLDFEGSLAWQPVHAGGARPIMHPWIVSRHSWMGSTAAAARALWSAGAPRRRDGCAGTSIAKDLEAAGRAREGGAPWEVGGWGYRTAPFHQRQPNHQKAPREGGYHPSCILLSSRSISEA
jgi:hypothetical protein